MDREQIQSKYAGWTQLAMNRDHKQAIAITEMNHYVSQNSSELLHQMRNCKLVKIVSVSSFNHSSTAVSISL